MDRGPTSLNQHMFSHFLQKAFATPAKMASKIILGSGIALITGAASGIGRETAFAFAEAAVDGVAFADINEHGAQESAKESRRYATNPNYRCISIHVDICNEESVQKMVDTTIKEFGRIDYSVNSAGIGNTSGAVMLNLKADFFSKIMDINVRGTMLCNREVARAMSKQEPLTYVSSRHGSRTLGRGSIVNLASVNSFIAVPGMMPYTTSKHAVVGVTKSAALDCAQFHVRVNSVCPSWTDTAMMQASLVRVPSLGQLIKTASPLGRAANPEEVADCILFLCSPSASYVNGASLLIDAGLSLTAHVI
ncbi:NAD(P)-binding protein [Astrocystis sublimbata]|nr:NAD(P)-binding protein [Astrocystis sublimbata]